MPGDKNSIHPIDLFLCTRSFEDDARIVIWYPSYIYIYKALDFRAHQNQARHHFPVSQDDAVSHTSRRLTKLFRYLEISFMWFKPRKTQEIKHLPFGI